MKFTPAGEIIGKAHRVRTVMIVDSPQLPDGEYRFIDMYCTDPSCDCRKTMIQVFHNGAFVSTINYGWEPPSFYEKWMGGKWDDEIMLQMHGASIDITSPNRVSPKGILGLFSALLDEKWIGIIKKHYRAVKAKLDEDQRKKGKSRTRKFSGPKKQGR
ncbi:MAG: hypothetical protein HY879_21900 [Deltaproteobacteria bacterium]|nr:hypothetical protein [Deltaproteobacteria bacterium]